MADGLNDVALVVRIKMTTFLLVTVAPPTGVWLVKRIQRAEDDTLLILEMLDDSR